MKEIVLATVKFGSGQVVAMLCAAITVKIMAVIIGPAGVGLFSLLRQAQQMLGALATLGGQNAVVQGVASRTGDARDRFVVSVLWAFVASSLILAVIVIGFANPLTELMLRLDSYDAPWLFGWIAFPVTAGALLVFFRSLLNAHMRIGSAAMTNVVAAAGSLLLVYPAVVAYQRGFFVALVLLLGGSLSLGVVFAVLRARACGYLAAFRRVGIRTFDVPAVGHFLWVGLPSLVALFIGMASVLAVRTFVTTWHGLEGAGKFDAAWSISVFYLSVFLSALHSYLLPALSADTAQEPSEEVLDRSLRLALIVSVPMITCLIVLKPLVVRLLYTEEFLSSIDLLRWTLIGDYFRVGGWILATSLVARADMRAYLACEVLWNAILTGGAFWLVEHSIEGAGPVYLTAYAVYLAALFIRARGHHGYLLEARTLTAWAAGAAIVVLASILTWDDVLVAWPKASLALLAGALSWFAVTAAEKQAVFALLARRFAR
jgi:PST family polysaccharide transporter